MAQKNKIHFAGVILLLLISLPFFGCTRKPPLQEESAPSSEEASTDAKLGTLSETEAAKQLKRLEDEEDTEQTLAALRQSEREEEERRTHRRLTEDKILADQT